MDKKKKMMRTLFLIVLFTFGVVGTFAQEVSGNAGQVDNIQFCDKKYDYQSDSITLCFNILNLDGKRLKNYSVSELNERLSIYAGQEKEIAPPKRNISFVQSGQRIPADMTFSVLVDLNIPDEGKQQIREVVKQLVESAPDSSIYLSFFGDKISSTKIVTKDNFSDFDAIFRKTAASKYFFSAVMAKLAEFSSTTAVDENGKDLESCLMALEDDYSKNMNLTQRSEAHQGKNLIFIITDSKTVPINERDRSEDGLDYLAVTQYHRTSTNNMPKVFAFYFTDGNSISDEDDIYLTLNGVTGKARGAEGINPERKGDFKDCADISSIIDGLKDAIEEQSYDYLFTYKVGEYETYAGKTIHYIAKWRGEEKGSVDWTIGTKERPWPERVETAGDNFLKYLMALLVTALTIAFFFFVMKVLVPLVKSKSFEMKYYKKYEPEKNINRRICSYCKQDIRPGDYVVTKCINDPKCGHMMHVHCWKTNHYHCAEYGQRCTDGTQQHVEWGELFTWRSLRDCHLTIVGIFAGLLSWIIYEMMGRGGFSSLATHIVIAFFTNEEQFSNHFETCVTKVSAFLAIGMLLGFFLSVIFRYNDEYREKNWKIYLKIFGLSIVSALIGMAAFALGGAIFCLILSAINTTNVPWYCSLPAYLLFSICVSLSLTIKSSIPLKSALWGGLISAVIGFIVLYFSDMVSGKWSWMNMLLNFIIYGGGLGASLVTVRMLAEKYWLVIMDGVKKGTRIPIHKWMNATGGSNKVTIGMTYDCEIMMNWEKSNKVAKEHAQLYINHDRSVPVIKPMSTGVIYNMRAELPVNKESILSSGDIFKIGDTTFKYTETE